MMWCPTCQSHHDFDYEYCPEKWARDRAHERLVRARRDRAELDARIASRSSVSKDDFPAWWAAYWRHEAATSLFDLHEPAEKSDEQHIHDALIFGTSFRRVTYDWRLDPGVNSQGRAAYADGILTADELSRLRAGQSIVPEPEPPVAHMSTSWVHADDERAPEKALKTVFISHERAHAAAGALGIALLRVVDEQGQSCPLPLRPSVSSGAPEALQQILQAAAIQGFTIVVGRPAPTHSI